MTTVGYRMVMLLVLATVFSVSAGCGQKGDLYLPDKSPKPQHLVTH